MLQDIDAGSTKPNTPFKGTVTEDVLRNGKVIVPVGSELHGRVVYASAGNRMNGGSVLHLRPDEFVLPDGTRYHLHAQVIDTFGSDTKAKGEGNIVANEHGKRTIAELGMGAGGGAVLGAAVGAGVGAVVGTAVGAGIVTAHWLRTNWSANLPAHSTVVFSLTDPMFLNPGTGSEDGVATADVLSEGREKLQIPPLRFAPVGMTKRREWLSREGRLLKEKAFRPPSFPLATAPSR